MGYEIERFQQDVEDFLCPICLNVLEDPMQLKRCEHMFCRYCIEQWIYKSLSCPVDRMQIRGSHLRETSRFFQIYYHRLKLQCQFVKSGCNEMVGIETIAKHELLCPYSDDGIGDIVLHAKMIDKLKSNWKIQSIQVENVMLAVDRGLFCAGYAYDDEAKRINYGATISAPHMHAAILELLQSKLLKHSKVLDIGSGSGYLTICMATMLESTGKVIGIDHVSQFIEKSKRQIRRNFSHLNKSHIEFITRDGREGYAAGSPYDVINIGGAINEVPQPIIDQLKPGGRIIVPLIYAEGQKLVSIDKLLNGEVRTKEHMRNVKFGLITDLETQYKNR